MPQEDVKVKIGLVDRLTQPLKKIVNFIKSRFVITLGNLTNAFRRLSKFIIDAVKRASPNEITVVIPYFGYARQDSKATSREPITAKLVANLLATAGANRILTIDLHTDQIQGFFDIPLDHLTAFNLFADYFSKKDLKNFVVVSPDIGSIRKARRFCCKWHRNDF